MDTNKIEEIIKIKAVELFSKKGFHGTSIRDIAKEAGCSIPMIYYYYQNKNELFEKIVYTEFLELIERLNSSIPRGLTLEETYFLAIKQRKELNSYDRAVYKLVLKVALGFEGSTEIIEKLRAWEKERYERNKKILSKICSDELVLENLVTVVLGLFQYFTQQIILYNEDISDEKIRKTIKFVIESNKSN